MLIPTYLRKNRFILYSTVYAHKQIGDKSAAGRGGMAAKIGAATRAVQGGVTSVVIANGIHPYTIEQVSMVVSNLLAVMSCLSRICICNMRLMHV